MYIFYNPVLKGKNLKPIHYATYRDKMITSKNKQSARHRENNGSFNVEKI